MINPQTLAQITQRFQFLEARLAEGVAPAQRAALTREYSGLRPVVDAINAYDGLLEEIDGAEAMLSDPEMRALAEDELPRLRERP
jgi:peptide chain release factor 1